MARFGSSDPDYEIDLAHSAKMARVTLEPSSSSRLLEVAEDEASIAAAATGQTVSWDSKVKAPIRWRPESSAASMWPATGRGSAAVASRRDNSAEGSMSV